MSSEPVKLEVDCTVAAFSHHHHHHRNPHHLHSHHLHHHHHHHHLHHNAHDIDEDEENDEELVDEEEEEEEDEEEEDLDEDDVFGTYNKHDKSPAILTNTKNKIEGSEEEEQITDDSGSDGDSSSARGKANDKYENDSSNSNANSRSTSSNSSTSPASSSSSSGDSDEADEDDGDENDEDEDDELVGEDEDAEEEDGADEDEVDEDGDDEDDDEDDDDEDDESIDSRDDFVDPVGNHQHPQHHLILDPQQHHLRPLETIGSNHQSNSTPCNNFNCLSSSSVSNEISDDPSINYNNNITIDNHSFNNENELIETNSLFSNNNDSTTSDILDGEKMLEVTRKLVKSTERDPDRDLRKQVLLRTAIRKLPHFMEYNRYSDSFDQNFQLHNNDNNNLNPNVNCLTPSQYYEHHHHHHIHMSHIDSQPESYYHSVQPNAIQMSTTSLRMLDLNDDQEHEANPIETDHHLGYATTDNTNCNSTDNCRQTSLEQHNYASSHHNQINHHHQQTPNEFWESLSQMGCPTGGTIEDTIANNNGDQSHQGSEGTNSSSSQSSTASDDSVNSIASQSNDSIAEETNGKSFLETSIISSSDFYHSSHDSGVGLFSPRSNKRSSSSIGLDDEMEIDNLTDLSSLNQLSNTSIGSPTNHQQFKRLRKREIIE